MFTQRILGLSWRKNEMIKECDGQLYLTVDADGYLLVKGLSDLVAVAKLSDDILLIRDLDSNDTYELRKTDD